MITFLRQNSKAVSAVIGTILFITIATAATILVYTWAMSRGFTNTVNEEEKLEDLIIENVWFYQDGTVKLVVRNVGSIEVQIESIYIDGVLKYSTSPPVVLNVDENVVFTLTDVSPTYQLFKVTTLRGSEFHEYHGPSY